MLPVPLAQCTQIALEKKSLPGTQFPLRTDPITGITTIHGVTVPHSYFVLELQFTPRQAGTFVETRDNGAWAWQSLAQEAWAHVETCVHRLYASAANVPRPAASTESSPCNPQPR